MAMLTRHAVAAEAPIAKSDLASRAFTRIADNGITKGGATEKYLLQDDSGTVWLFKPMRPDEAAVEEAGRRLTVLCGFYSPEVYSVSVGKLSGSLVRIEKVDGSLQGKTPAQLSADEAGALLDLQVLEWL